MEVTEQWVALGPATDIPPGKTKDFEVDDDHSVLVANCGGTYHAIEDRCTHDDGPLGKGRLYGCEVECPRHGAKFDMRTGKATALPAFQAVTNYAVRVNGDGEIEVNLAAKKPPAAFEDPLGRFQYGI
jgi:3-phenylpropionate/trans-cinnamate dioxygenase ferredoxin subunit